MKRWLTQRAAKHFLKCEIADAGLMHVWKGIESQTGMEPWNQECRDAAKQLVKRIQWPKYKLPSHLTIDDRAICFKGEYPTVESIKGFESWVRSAPKETDNV